MAKGNDGNYLQHGIEVAVAMHLVSLRSEGRLHIALTHGMAPSEPCEGSGRSRKFLNAVLTLAGGPQQSGEPRLVTAYRAVSASMKNYPNTGELLAAMVGRDRLSDGITEVDTADESVRFSQLKAAWANTTVTPVQKSWRNQLGADGVLACPSALRAPWLFSMDPMSYRENGSQDDDQLYRADKDRISEALTNYVLSDCPGVATIFVYALSPHGQRCYWRFVKELADATEMQVLSCWLAHSGEERNLAAVFCSGVTLPSNWLPTGVNLGR